MNVLSIKKWCDVNLYPMSWTRIVMRLLPLLNAHQMYLQNVQMPNSTIVFPREIVETIKKLVEDLYDEDLANEFNSLFLENK